MKLIFMGFFLLLFVILNILYCLKRLYSLINNDELFTTALVEGYAVDWRTNDSKILTQEGYSVFLPIGSLEVNQRQKRRE